MRAFTVILALLLCFATQGSRAADYFLLPEPKFMGHKAVQPIPGAKSTVLAVARIGPLGPEFPSRVEWETSAITDDSLSAIARRQSAAWLEQVAPVLVRDKKKVVEYAVLQSSTVPVAATVLAPEFWRRFEEVFGPKMRVVIPNRQTVYVFPDVAGDLTRYTPMVMEAWRGSHPKVSLEVFELTEKGLKAIGVFEEP